MRYVKSGLCQLGWVSCMGCCGHGYKDKLSVAKGIEKNTLEYKDHAKRGISMPDFLNRSKDRRECGVCRNLIFDTKSRRLICPGHPEQNNGTDHRVKHHYCDILHVCKTAFLFDLWDEHRKQDFVKFLKQKRKGSGLDWYSYSKGMADGSLLEEFEGMKWD